MKVLAFALYSILFETLVWGGFGYAVFWQDRSGWWFLLAVLISSSQMKPEHFGIGRAK